MPPSGQHPDQPESRTHLPHPTASFAQIAMSEKKTVGSMTERQRRTLAAMLTAVPPSGAEAADAQQDGDQAAELEHPPFGISAGISAHRARSEHRAMALSH